MRKPVPMRVVIARAVASQIQYDNPPETRKTLRRLLDLGYSELDAKAMIGKAMACHYYRVMCLQEPPDKLVYERDLQQLPVLPWELDAGITENAVIRDVLDNTNIDTRTEEEWRARYQELRSTTFTIHNAMIKLMGKERLFESARALGMAHGDSFVSQRYGNRPYLRPCHLCRSAATGGAHSCLSRHAVCAGRRFRIGVGVHAGCEVLSAAV